MVLGKFPTGKLPPGKLPPIKLPPRKITSHKILTWNIPTHLINCLSSLNTSPINEGEGGECTCTSFSLDKNVDISKMA